MPLRSTFSRVFFQQRWSVLTWSVALVALAAAMSAIYIAIADDPAIQQIVENYPPALKVVLGLEGFDLRNPASYYKHELFALLVPGLFLVFSVTRGASAIPVEEERKSLDLLLSLPVQRTRLLLEKFGAICAALAALGSVLFIGLMASSWVLDLNVDAWKVFAACTMVVLLGVFASALSTSIGAATGRQGISSGITITVIVASYLLYTLAPLVDWLQPLRVFSPYYYYAGADPLLKGFQGIHAAILLTLSAIPLVLGAVRFQIRDIR